MSNRNRSKTRQYRGPVPVASTQRIVAYSPSRGVLYFREGFGGTMNGVTHFCIKRGTIPTHYGVWSKETGEMPKAVPTKATVGDWRRAFEDSDCKEPGDIIYLPITIKGTDTAVTIEELRRIGLGPKELTSTLSVSKRDSSS